MPAAAALIPRAVDLILAGMTAAQLRERVDRELARRRVRRVIVAALPELLILAARELRRHRDK